MPRETKSDTIAKLTEERDQLLEIVAKVRDQLVDLEVYLTSPKFTAPDCDYVHVRTDILPKLRSLRFSTCEY